MKTCKFIIGRNTFIFFIIVNFLFLSCKNESNGTIPKEKKVIEKKRVNYINHFMFFKQGMSYDEIVNVLKQNKIIFHNITYKESYDGSNSDISNISKTGYKIKIIKGKSLKLLNTEIPEFQILFIDNKIVRLSFESSKSELGNEFFATKIIPKHKNEIDDKINKDLYFLNIIYNSLLEKYGEPSIKEGLDNIENISPIHDDDNSPKDIKMFRSKWWGDCPEGDGTACFDISIYIERKRHPFLKGDMFYYDTTENLMINFEYKLQNNFYKKIDSINNQKSKILKDLNDSKHKTQIKDL